MTDIRAGRIDDKPELKALWKHCFFDTDEYINYWFDTVFAPERAVVCEENGKICGALHLIPYTLHSKGEAYRLMYIYAFGVRTELRGRGVGRKILSFTEDFCRKMGIQLLFLISDADGFYEKCGYTLCSERLEVEIYGKGEYSDTVNSADAAKIYESYAGNFDAYLSRDFEKTEKELHACGGGILKTENAYLAYEKAKFGRCPELAYTDKKEAEKLISAALERFGEITLVLPLNNDFGYYNAKKVHGVMAKSLCEKDAREAFCFGGNAFISVI